MSFSFKIPKDTLDKLRSKVSKIADVMTRDVADEIGKETIVEMKNLISRGISPIRGAGRFPGYLRANEPDGYPNRVPKELNKKKRPVNLKLEGHFLESMKFETKKIGSQFKTTIFFDTDLSKLKEQGHREGANGQPKRPTIPQADQGQTFAISIQKKIIDIINTAIQKIIRG